MERPARAEDVAGAGAGGVHHRDGAGEQLDHRHGDGSAVRLARPSAAGAGTDQRAAVLSAGTSAHRR